MRYAVAVPCLDGVEEMCAGRDGEVGKTCRNNTQTDNNRRGERSCGEQATSAPLGRGHQWQAWNRRRRIVLGILTGVG